MIDKVNQMRSFLNPFVSQKRGLGRSVLITLLFGAAAATVQAGIPIQHWTQANGVEVFLVESPAIPMVDVLIEFDGGSRRDPKGQAGLAAATANLVGIGVKASAAGPALDENQLGEAWADLGAGFGASASGDRLSYSLRTLTDPAQLKPALALAARILTEPSLPAPLWQREQERWQAALKESETQPGTVAAKAFGRAVYGDHPYGQKATAASLGAIQISDMQAYLKRTLNPCHATATVVGALSRAQAEAAVNQLTRGLSPGVNAQAGKDCASNALPAISGVAPLQAAQTLRIPFDSAQAHVIMGQPGIKRSDPDYFPLLVGNYILGGGGFVSRLTQAVREERGLSYSVSSGFSPGLHEGAFSIGLQTRPDQADQALKVAREVLDTFLQEGPTEAELQAAKENLIGGFPLRIDSNRKLLDNVANMARHRLPLNYLDTWTQQIQHLTVADVRAAMVRHLQPNRMVTVLVGAQP